MRLPLIGLPPKGTMESSEGQVLAEISFWSGQFRDSVLEERFRRDLWPLWWRQIRTVGLWASLFFLLGWLVDYGVVDDPSQRWTLLGIRVAFAAFCVVVSLSVRRLPHPYLADYVTLIAMLACAAATCVIIFLSPLGLFQPTMTVFVITLCFYFFVPNRLVFNLVSSLALGLGFLLVAVIYIQPPGEDLTLMGLYLLLANLLGLVTLQRLHVLHRQEYLNLMAEREANQRLRQEIEHRRRAEVSARDSEDRYRRLVELSPDAIVVHRRGKILYANSAARRLIGLPPEADLSKLSLFDFLHPAYHHLARERLEALDQGALHLPPVEVEMICPDGRTICCEVLSGPVMFEDQPAVQSIVRNITLRKRMELELRYLATNDPLTGAYNSRHFEELSQREMDRARRYQRPLSVLRLDIDHFKRINLQWGHRAGDQVLKEVVRHCRDILRSPDILGRLGGEEFGITLPETARKEALAVAERLRRALARLKVPWQGNNIGVTVSIGVVECADQDQDIQDCLRRAAMALQQAKETGRDRVVPA